MLLHQIYLLSTSEAELFGDKKAGLIAAGLELGQQISIQITTKMSVFYC